MFSRTSAAEAAVCPPAAPQGPVAELRSLEQVRRAGRSLRMTAIKGVDLSQLDAAYWRAAEIDATYFLGCRFADREAEEILQQKGAVIMPRLQGLPYDPYRTALYTFDELEEARAPGLTANEAIYCDYVAKGRLSPGIIDALAQRIHDDSIDDAFRRFVQEKGVARFVGIMGATETARTDPWFRKTAETAWRLGKAGKIVLSGGGPGIMEAANLGAYLSAYDEAALDHSLRILAVAPNYREGQWRASAAEVRRRFPEGADNVTVSSWFFGSYPINSFFTHGARYFDRSIRESQLIEASRSGIVFAPGSAGTREEIFMDAEQSHHSATGELNLMVFIGKQQYEIYVPVYPLLRELANAKDRLFITDSPAEAAAFIVKSASP